MDLFHKIPDAQVILFTSGVYKQVDVYQRGDKLFAAHSGGYVRLCGKSGQYGGTSKPNISWIDLDVPERTIDPRFDGPRVLP